jgi:hypothetical protein
MVGMEVDLPATSHAFVWRLAPALALSVVLVFVSAFGYQQFLYAQPIVAYLTVDSTGSVELEINQAGLVKSATAIDEAGQQALSSIEFKNKPAEEVVAALMKAQDPEKTAEVVVAVVPVPAPEASGQSEKQSKKAEKAVEKMERKVVDEAGHSSPNVTSLRLDHETRESARQLGISAGRAALWALTHKEEPGSEDPGTSVETPGQEEPVKEPGGEGEQPGTHPEDEHPGSNPPGQEKKDDILDTIKGALPQVSDEDLTDLNEQKDNKDREKFLKDLTKDWIDQVKTQIKEQEEKGQGQGQGHGQGKDADEDSGKGSGKSDNEPGQKGAESPPPSPSEDKTKDNGNGKGKGTGANPAEDTGTPPTAIASSDEHNTAGGWTTKRGAIRQTLDDIIRRLPWMRRK